MDLLLHCNENSYILKCFSCNGARVGFLLEETYFFQDSGRNWKKLGFFHFLPRVRKKQVSSGRNATLQSKFKSLTCCKGKGARGWSYIFGLSN